MDHEGRIRALETRVDSLVTRDELYRALDKLKADLLQEQLSAKRFYATIVVTILTSIAGVTAAVASIIACFK